MFNIPSGGKLLATSNGCPHQAFRAGHCAYGLQFHVEVTEAMIRAWLANAENKKELSSLKGQIDPAVIRAQTAAPISRLEELSRHIAETFCGFLDTSPTRKGSPAHARR